ncbi:MAG: flagellar export protein FliJ [Sulfurospirillaceae bacterium]|nr:flagellar export protein FliJ [Sulfurospirillaceae bacterium]MDD3462696.1 flagellar export protein FliJ [Sulfurospirillaceae bacterium]
MKSKFANIAKIKKQKCDTIEKELLKNRTREKMLLAKIATSYEEISKMSLPKEGGASLISMFQAQKALLNRDKKAYELALVEAKKRIQKLLDDYKKAHTDYEKIKYLEEQELQIFIDKLKKEEQKELDEIANVLFSNIVAKKG